MCKLCDIKEKLVDIMYEVVMTDDLSSVCTKELYEVMDIIKDIEETKYYKSITDAMEKSDEPEEYVKKYVPAYSNRMYYHREEEKEITMDDVMDYIDEVFESCTTKEECIKKKQDLINFINKIPM